MAVRPGTGCALDDDISGHDEEQYHKTDDDQCLSRHRVSPPRWLHGHMSPPRASRAAGIPGPVSASAPPAAAPAEAAQCQHDEDDDDDDEQVAGNEVGAPSEEQKREQDKDE